MGLIGARPLFPGGRTFGTQPHPALDEDGRRGPEEMRKMFRLMTVCLAASLALPGIEPVSSRS